jgi:hypothetical protein
MIFKSINDSTYLRNIRVSKVSLVHKLQLKTY